MWKCVCSCARARMLTGRLLAVKWRRVVAWRTRRIRRRRWWRQIIYVVICVVIHRQRSSPYQKEQTRNGSHPPYGGERMTHANRERRDCSARPGMVFSRCKQSEKDVQVKRFISPPTCPLHFAVCPLTVSSKALIVHACGEFPHPPSPPLNTPTAGQRVELKAAMTTLGVSWRILSGRAVYEEEEEKEGHGLSFLFSLQTPLFPFTPAPNESRSWAHKETGESGSSVIPLAREAVGGGKWEWRSGGEELLGRTALAPPPPPDHDHC